jgi:PHP family Zn ribbon phosphoesterase
MPISADLHIHSSLSPCGCLEMSPRAIVERSLEQGLDVIAVTDHNSVENAFYASELGERLGLAVICGMEAQTEEDVHVLCLFPDPESAEAFYGRVYPLLPDVANNPDYFGDQVVVDCEDQIVRVEPRLLLNSLELSLGALAELVSGHGGFLVPSHVESPHSGLMTNLGLVPPELELCPLEISRRATFAEAVAAFPALAGRRLVANSDAHYLADIGRARTVYEVGAASLAELYRAAQAGRYRVVYEEG